MTILIRNIKKYDNGKIRLIGGQSTNIYLKAFLFLLTFCLFHYGYEITGMAFLKPFCGTNESVFQHLKMAFWGYALLSLIEFLLLKRRIKGSINNFVYSRMLSAVLVPWVILLTWYLLPAVLGKVESLFFEVLWSVLVTYLSGLFVIRIERETEKIQFQVGTRVILCVLVAISIVLFVVFTYRQPWIDLFVNPETLNK
ncbi:MAG: hypothetical protein DRP63_05750 [Planctomycetota bacterium]|nr:MAG: hypothetical protein DRP63_05750 [Planctomycetota bacterium]